MFLYFNIVGIILLKIWIMVLIKRKNLYADTYSYFA